MKRLRGLLEGGWGLLVLVGLVGLAAVWLLFLRANSLPREVAQTSRFASPFNPTPSEPTRVEFQSPLPQIEPTVLPSVSPVTRPPPLCQFEQAGVSEAESPSQLDRFVFSEPQVIFSREAPIDIIEWLPDSRRLLVHMTIPLKQSIETVDADTGAIEVYADHLENARQVHWVEEQKGVVYTDRKTAQFSGVEQYAVWLSQDKGSLPWQVLADADRLQARENISVFPPGVARSLNVYDFPFDPEQWRYNKYPEDPYVWQSWREVKFASSVSPDGSKAVFYGIPWLYLVDLKTNQPCEVDLGQTDYVVQGPLRVFNALWSPDGRLLALQTAVGYREELMYFNKLIILNTMTGEWYRPEIEWSYVLDIEWFPDSRYLVVMGYVNDIDQPYPHQHQQIGMVDSLIQQFRLMLPNHVFGGASQSGFQLALSPNGKNLAISCRITSDKSPLALKDQVCFVTIN